MASASPGSGVSRSAAAKPQSIAALRHAALAFAVDHGATTSQCQDIALAVSEAVTNTVVHAYRNRDEPGAVRLDASTIDGILEIIVSDEGTGLAAHGDSPGLGLGSKLMAQLSERLEVESNDGLQGRRVRMTFEIG